MRESSERRTTRSKAPQNHGWPQPISGKKYLVTEWDGEQNIVRATQSSYEAVTIRYEDGLTHTVSVPYFFGGLSAKLLSEKADPWLEITPGHYGVMGSTQRDFEVLAVEGKALLVRKDGEEFRISKEFFLHMMDPRRVP